ncbi:MAG: hypothetical protein AAGJ40_14305 [Planctomycetota bacterium]
MAKLRFSVRQLLLGTAYVAAIIAVSQSWSSSGALAAPSVFYVGLLLASAFFALRRYALPRFLFPHALGLSLAALTLMLSLGPACFLMTRLNINHKTHPRISGYFSYVYRPIGNSFLFSPEPIRSFSIRYVSLWFPEKTPLIDTGWGLQWSIPSSWQRI